MNGAAANVWWLNVVPVCGSVRIRTKKPRNTTPLRRAAWRCAASMLMERTGLGRTPVRAAPCARGPRRTSRVSPGDRDDPQADGSHGRPAREGHARADRGGRRQRLPGRRDGPSTGSVPTLLVHPRRGSPRPRSPQAPSCTPRCWGQSSDATSRRLRPPLRRSTTTSSSSPTPRCARPTTGVRAQPAVRQDECDVGQTGCLSLRRGVLRLTS